MTDRIGLDSTSWQAVVATIKAKVEFRGLPVTMALGYLDGSFAWPAQAWAELEALGIDKRELVGYTVTGASANAFKARAGDAEPGDMTPAGVAAWAKGEHDRHELGAPYCDRAWKPLVIAECGKLGLRLGVDYGLIVATLDGTFTDSDGSDLRKQPGVFAIQYEQAHSPLWSGGPADLDVTLVTNAGWRAKAAPKPPPAKVLDGYLVTAGGAGGFAGRAVTSSDDGKTWS